MTRTSKAVPFIFKTAAASEMKGAKKPSPLLKNNEAFTSGNIK